MPSTRKLIEVALPLDEINAACKADKDRKTGTIRNLHKWFAPMPLPAWRALLFAALVDDPGDEESRLRLLDVVKRLVANGADLPSAEVLKEAQDILKAQFPEGVPPLMDPFAGGGSTLVEGQRLGLDTFGSDLNPVPALITRTLTETLPKVHGQAPLNHERARSVPGPNSEEAPAGLFDESLSPADGEGYDGLRRDVMFYAESIGNEAWVRLQNLYPSLPGQRPVAWLWARTAVCPNPACGTETPLLTSYWLSKKRGDLAWIEPTIQGSKIHLIVRSGQSAGEPLPSPKIGDGVFACVACSSVLDGPYLRDQGKRGFLGLRMTAVAVEENGMRTYRDATELDLTAIESLVASDSLPEVPINVQGQGIRVGLYGMETWDSIFTARQLMMLDTFADLVSATHARVIADGGSTAWADAVTTVLGLALGSLVTASSTQTRWRLRDSAQAKAEPAFGRNDLPMMWDFAETNPWGNSVGDWLAAVSGPVRALAYAPHGSGVVTRCDARTASLPKPGLVATDPPYFDAIGYADLSDFFYLWHRKALKAVHPDLYATAAAPKIGELTAIPSHHGNSKDAARRYFIEGFTETFRSLRSSLADDLPLILVYASKEQKGGAGEETRWSSILTAVVDAGLEITGTWPIHGTGTTRMVGMGTNAVATYVVMVCRPRPASAGTCSLADFNRSLRRELKSAVRDLQSAGILPVDLAQAAIGPGMQIFSRYREVLDQTGHPIGVDQALRLINAALGEVLDEQEGELDPDSRFAVAWWEKHGWEPAPFGEADQLARPQGISVDDVVRAGVATYPRPGLVALVGNQEMNSDWAPHLDSRPTAWEAVHHLASRLIDGGGVVAAGRLMAHLGVLRDPAQGLVYRLHAIAAKRGRFADQERYNALIGSWSDLLAIAATEKDGLF